MSDTVEAPHLTPEEVIKLLSFVSRYNPILVGGQSINIWSALFQGRDTELDGLGPLTSKDIDFFQNREAQQALIKQLQDGKLHLPTLDDHGPSASVVSGKLGDKEVQIDFLTSVKGVDSKTLQKRKITLTDETTGASVTLMHPLDCVRSRLSNINDLHRNEEHSLNQAIASIRIVDLFIDDALNDQGRLGTEWLLTHLPS